MSVEINGSKVSGVVGHLIAIPIVIFTFTFLAIVFLGLAIGFLAIVALPFILIGLLIAVL